MKISENKYYDYMCDMDAEMSFEEIHLKWYKCFHYILKSFNVGFSNKAIKSLFYDFQMDNWEELHKENSEYYKDKNKQEMIYSFCGECNYISDRTSYDRLFRTHWLFLKAFNEEINKIRYPSLYSGE